jgi:hypothetical protein
MLLLGCHRRWQECMSCASRTGRRAVVKTDVCKSLLMKLLSPLNSTEFLCFDLKLCFSTHVFFWKCTQRNRPECPGPSLSGGHWIITSSVFYELALHLTAQAIKIRKCSAPSSYLWGLFFALPIIHRSTELQAPFLRFPHAYLQTSFLNKW